MSGFLPGWERLSQISSSSGLKICPANTNHTSTYMHTHIHRAYRKIRHNAWGHSQCHFLSSSVSLHFFLCLSPSPSLSFVWPISRLAVTLPPHESQYGSRVLWTAAVQTKPSSLHTAMDQKHYLYVYYLLSVSLI